MQISEKITTIFKGVKREGRNGDICFRKPPGPPVFHSMDGNQRFQTGHKIFEGAPKCFINETVNRLPANEPRSATDVLQRKKKRIYPGTLKVLLDKLEQISHSVT